MNPEEEVVQELKHEVVPGYRGKFVVLFLLALVYGVIIFAFGSAEVAAH